MPPETQKRATLLYCILLGCFAVLTLRLYKLSDGNMSQTVLSGQYTRRLDVVSRDGFVYDRNLKLLSHQKCGFAILVNPAELKDSINSTALELSDVCDDITAESISETLAKRNPTVLYAENGANADSLKDKDGIYVFERFEENTSTAVHIIGYRDADKKGVCGLKKQYSDILDSLSGSVSASYEANARSGVLNGGGFTVNDELYSSYGGVVLTLDKDLQTFVESLEGTYIDSGAVAVCDVNTGELLAAASFPSYDAKSLASYISSDRGELVNRLTKTFTPGSVFKLIVAAAALEKDNALCNFTYNCTGEIYVADNCFHCHKTTGHGVQNLTDAFANSCNTYFVELGRQIGLDCIVKTAKSMGVGKKVFADFIRSDTALLPDTENASESVLANVSFGQGTLLLSPLDMINVTNVCATGKLAQLKLVRGIYSDGIFRAAKASNIAESVLKPETVESLKVMMRKCVTDGTGTAAFINGVANAGKTATAQTGQLSSNSTEILHKWFCGIYPLKNPKISVTVLCDGNGRSNVSPAEIFNIVNKFVINAGILSNG